MARSSNRRTTPQTEAARSSSTRLQQQTSRATRSRSREAPSTIPIEQTGRAKQRGARQASVESIDSVGARNTRTGGEDRTKAVNDLSTVDEAPSDQTSEPQDPPNIHPSPGGYSDISQATTAYSSLSAVEARELDQEFLSLALKPLHDTAEEMIKIIAPPDVHPSTLAHSLEVWLQPGNMHSKLYALKREAFTVHRKHFGPNDYIRPDVVEKALYLPKSPATLPSRPRVDELIQKADLALLANLLVDMYRDDTIAWNAICRLDKTFPLPFISSFSDLDAASGPLAVGQSKMLDKAAHLGIEIRTQLTIMHFSKAAEQGRFDPDVELFNIWFEPADPNSAETPTYRGWETTSLSGQGLSENVEAMVEERINEIKTFFAEDSQSVEHNDIVDQVQLRRHFPWLDFMLKALDWIRMRNDEINRAIKARGGVDKILRALKKEIGSSDPESQTPERTVASNAATPMRSALKGSAKKILAQYEFVRSDDLNLPHNNNDSRDWNRAYGHNWPEQMSGYQRRVSGGQTNITASHQPAATAPEFTTDVGGEDDWRPTNVDDEMDDFEAGPSAAPVHVDRIAQMKIAGKRNKENFRLSQNARLTERPRFIDAQKNAERVEWSQPSQPRSSTLPRKSQVGRGKRPAQVLDEEEDDMEEDDGFEKDRRMPDQARRKQAPPFARRAPAPSPKKVRVHQPEDDDDDDDEEGPVEPASIPSTNYREINQLSKDVTRMNPVKVQTRTRWTEEEAEALIDYIQALGTSWSAIKEFDGNSEKPALLRRDQGALKDKARNMKFDFLRAGAVLPMNFEYVAINASQIKKLSDLGIEDI